MVGKEVLRSVKRLQLRAKGIVRSRLSGAYHSAFKGSGLSFEEVREYQPGDDIRTIDWNVTARMGSPFIKRFVEERELIVYLLVDISASMNFGMHQFPKRHVAGELSALIAFAALANQDRVGVCLVSEQIERWLPASKGHRQTLRILRDILFHAPQRPRGNLALGLDHLNQIQKRRAIVFVLSDFLDDGYQASLRRTANQHDVIAVQILDPWEIAIPNLGLVRIEDSETGQQRLIDTGSKKLREQYQAHIAERMAAHEHFLRSHRIDHLNIRTDGQHLEELLRFFVLRERRRKHG